MIGIISGFKPKQCRQKIKLMLSKQAKKINNKKIFNDDKKRNFFFCYFVLNQICI